MLLSLLAQLSLAILLLGFEKLPQFAHALPRLFRPAYMYAAKLRLTYQAHYLSQLVALMK